MRVDAFLARAFRLGIKPPPMTPAVAVESHLNSQVAISAAVTALAVAVVALVALHRWWTVQFMTHLMKSGALSGRSSARYHWHVLRAVVFLGVNRHVSIAHEGSRFRAKITANTWDKLMSYRVFRLCFSGALAAVAEAEAQPSSSAPSPMQGGMAQPQFELWVGLWEEGRHESDALMAYLRKSGAPWLVARLIMRTYYSVRYHVDPNDGQLCSTVKLAGIATHSKYVDGAVNVLKLPLPGLRVRNTATFTVKEDTIRVDGNVSYVGGKTLSANITLMTRHPATDEIELKTIDEKNGTYSRFLRRIPERS